jgi:transposase
MRRASAAYRRLLTIPGVVHLTTLALVSAIDDPARMVRSEIRGLSGVAPRAVSVRGGALPQGRQCHADALQRPAQIQGLGLRDRQAIHNTEGQVALAGSLAIIMHAMLRDGTEIASA